MCSGTPKDTARKRQALGATPTSSTMLSWWLASGTGWLTWVWGPLYRFDYVKPAGTAWRKNSPSCSLRFLPHLGTASGSVLGPVCPCEWAPQPSLHLGSVSDTHAYPHGDGWVAPVLQGQGQQITMVVMTKLTSSQAGSYDHS